MHASDQTLFAFSCTSSMLPTHVEGLLRVLVHLAVRDRLESGDGVLERHVLAGRAGEHLGDEERLGEEALDLAGSRHHQLVLVGELVHAEDRDDVAQLLVALEDTLHPARHIVVLGADDERVELAARRIERVDRRVDAELRDLAREHQGRIEVGEGRRRGRVREVVGRDVNSLDRGDRTRLRRGDALLQHPHLLCQRRLIADRRRHAP